MDDCPKCNQNDKVKVSKIGANCLCDRDFCMGQRCGVNDMVTMFKCERCNYEYSSKEYNNYVEYHCKD